jgi:hypothetical protein
MLSNNCNSKKYFSSLNNTKEERKIPIPQKASENIHKLQELTKKFLDIKASCSIKAKKS